MLDRVMRRFGVSRDDRAPTYYEALLETLRPRVAERVAEHPSQSLLEAVVGELLELEPQAARAGLRDLVGSGSLEAYREYLRFLCDNDRLPPAGQLTAKELATARKLIIGASEKGEQNRQVYDQVLALLEAKFSAGDFTQAALLLRLFETTAARRRANERTLFYEEMLARFGVPRVNRISRSNCRRFQRALGTDDEPAERLQGAARWLAQHAGIRLNLLTRDSKQLHAWEDALAAAENDEDKAMLLDALVPARWRAIDEMSDLSLVDGVKLHLGVGALSAYLARLLKACYFIVVVTTKTGFEPFIRSYFDWVDRHFGFPGSRLLPRLHKRTTLEEGGLEETIETMRGEEFDGQTETLATGFDDVRITEGFKTLTTWLKTVDPNDIPPGDFDLTGLVIDAMTGMSCCDDPTVMFRVHRIC